MCVASDHHAVLHPVEALGGQVVSVDHHGIVDLGSLSAALDASVSLVSVALVNNEIGTIQPLEEIADVVRTRAPNALLHVDAAQATSWLNLREHAAPADLITLASHKCGGPRGIGALVIRAGASIAPQQIGGGQERERRSGTQDVAGALGFAAAVEAADAEREALIGRVRPWRDALVHAVLDGVPGSIESAVPATGRAHLVPGIVNVCLPEVDSEAVLFLLEQEHRVLASAASSCASGAREPSHVLASLGIDREMARGSLRVSMGWSTVQADIDAAMSAIPAVAARLQAHAQDGTPA